MRSPFLWLALLLHVAFATAYAVRTPDFEGPDENSHYEYAWHLGNAGTLPLAPKLAAARNLPQTDAAVLAHHPPLYYALLGAAMAATGRDDTVFGPRGNPAFGQDGAASHALHNLHEANPDPLLRWLRMLSVALGAITVLCVHRIGHITCPDAPRVADLAALLVACLPMFSALHGLLNNGTLATTLSTATLLALVGCHHKAQITTVRAAGVGTLLGLALLTKLTTLFLILPAVTVAALALRAHRMQLPAVAAAIAMPLLLSGWLFWRNAALYGDPLAMNVHDASFQPLPAALRVPYLLGVAPWPDHVPSFWPTVFTSLLGRFGWFSVPPHPALVSAGAITAALALLGLLLARFADRTRRHAPQPLWLLLLWSALVLAGTTWFNLTTPQPQGRLLFPAIAPAAILIAAGLVHLTHRFTRRRWLVVVLPAVAATVFCCTFAPALDPSLAPAPADHRTLVGGIVAPRGPITITWLDTPEGAAIAAPPTLRFADPDAPAGTRYTLYAFDERGRVLLATHEWTAGAMQITAPTLTLDDLAWRFLPLDLPVQLRLRRVPADPEVDPATLPTSAPLRLTRTR